MDIVPQLLVDYSTTESVPVGSTYSTRYRFDTIDDLLPGTVASSTWDQVWYYNSVGAINCAGTTRPTNIIK